MSVSYEDLAIQELAKAEELEGSHTWTAPLSASRPVAEYHVAKAQVYATLAVLDPAEDT